MIVKNYNLSRIIMRSNVCIAIYLLFSTGLYQAQAQNEYSAQYVGDAKVLVDGVGGDAAWKQATVLSDFTYPWRDELAPLTKFRGVWSDGYFYFLFEADDGYVHLVDDPSIGEEDQAVGSDRVEIFFKNQKNTKPYYSLEMDASGRLFDSKATFDKRNGIDREWDWLDGHLEIRSSTQGRRYTVEGRISIGSLKELELLTDRVLYAGLYRGEYAMGEDGEMAVKWISWVKPDSPTPNFHIPSSFGVIRLDE